MTANANGGYPSDPPVTVCTKCGWVGVPVLDLRGEGWCGECPYMVLPLPTSKPRSGQENHDD